MTLTDGSPEVMELVLFFSDFVYGVLSSHTCFHFLLTMQWTHASLDSHATCCCTHVHTCVRGVRAPCGICPIGHSCVLALSHARIWPRSSHGCSVPQTRQCRHARVFARDNHSHADDFRAGTPARTSSCPRRHAGLAALACMPVALQCMEWPYVAMDRLGNGLPLRRDAADRHAFGCAAAYCCLVV